MSDRSNLDDDAIAGVLVRLGLAEPGEPARCVALAGGVSSDIRRVDLPGRSVCVKRALARLRVAADWRVPVERSAFEAQWLRVAHGLCPSNVPPPLGFDAQTGTLVLPWLPPDTHPVWKSQLSAGRVDLGVATALGSALAAIHGGTAGQPSVAAAFDTGPLFHALRLEPYLVATARRHPDLAARLDALARRTAGTRRALVHGDVSPKNVLVGPGGPLLIDAECAWYGDPAFDAAFCLNHLLLKCLWVPAVAADLLEAFDALQRTWLDRVAWEPRDEAAARVATLLPALMLARIDGKSPVEYLTEPWQQAAVRGFARRLLADPVATPAALANAWRDELAG